MMKRRTRNLLFSIACLVGVLLLPADGQIRTIQTVTADSGGTGITSYTIGDLLYASATDTLSKLAAVATGSVLCSQGVGTAPAWCSDVSLAGHLTFTTDNAKDIGADGATRPRTGYFGTSVVSPVLNSGSANFSQQWNGTVRDFGAMNQRTLTEASATAVVQLAIPSNSLLGARIAWIVCAEDATPDLQCRSGETYLAAVNKAGAETCTVGDIGTPVVAVSAGTLTVTTGCSTTPTNAVNFTIDATSSLTQTTLDVRYRVFREYGSGAITPQ